MRLCEGPYNKKGLWLSLRIAERRLSWFEHVSRMRSERLPANILHRSVNERREQWRQLKSGWPM